MLTIQPKVTNSVKFNTPAFGQKVNDFKPYGKDEYVDYVDVSAEDELDDEASYKSTRQFWEEQKAQYEDFANDTSLPAPVKKGAKLFSIVSNAAIDAIAVFYTGKYTINGIQKLVKSPKVQKFFTSSAKINKVVKGAGDAVVDGAGKLGAKVSETGIYQKMIKGLGNLKNSFMDLEFVKSVKNNKIVKNLTGALKSAGAFVVDKANATSAKLKGITAEQYTTYAAGTLATGAGIAGAVDEVDKYFNECRAEYVEAA